MTVLFDTLAAKGDDFPRTTLALLVSLVKNMEARAWPDADAVVMRMLKDLSVDDNRWYFSSVFQHLGSWESRGCQNFMLGISKQDTN